MVRVADVLRHLSKEIYAAPSKFTRLIALVRDIRTGRCTPVHPGWPALQNLNDFPALAATGLFVGECTDGAYSGTFYWFDQADYPPRDTRVFRQCFAEYGRLMNYEPPPEVKPYASRNPICGALLICRNGDGWVTIGLLPVDMEAHDSLMHVHVALEYCLHILNEGGMAITSPMIDAAQHTMQYESHDPRDQMLLNDFFTAFRKHEFVLAGAMPGEEDAIYDPAAEGSIDFIFAVRAFQPRCGNIHTWSASHEYASAGRWFDHRITRQHKYLSRRNSIIRPEQIPELDSIEDLPDVPIHAAWIVTRTTAGQGHPTTHLLVHRSLLLPIGLALLDEAAYSSY